MDQARQIAQLLGMTKEWAALNNLFSAILGTHEDKDKLISKEARARSLGRPFDSNRVFLFEKLFSTLKQSIFVDRSDNENIHSWRNTAFLMLIFQISLRVLSLL